MGAAEYRTARRRLLEATAWNAWASSRGYSAAAAARRKDNQRQLAALRAGVQRRAGR